MKYIAIVVLMTLLLVSGCQKQGIKIVAPADVPAEGSAEPTELAGDVASLEEEQPVDVDIDTAELEQLDM